jgi:hypothetical protein
MMKNIIMLLLVLLIGANLAAQSKGNLDDLIFGDQNDSGSSDDIIKVNFEKKNARRAMLYSAILPGAGQFYADRTAISTYIFPVLELAMIGGIIYFYGQGNSKTKDFEQYATGDSIVQIFNYTVNGQDYSYTYHGPRYNRSYQEIAQNKLKSVHSFDVYDDGFFRLDPTNTQHFYEDIGKYNKYIFGWADWFHNFATDPTNPAATNVFGDSAFDNVWIWTGNPDPQTQQYMRWTGNIRIEDFMNGNTGSPVSPGTSIASPMRQEFIQMRKDANQMYGYGRLFSLGLVFNHIASAVDAVLLTNKVNRMSLSDSGLKFRYFTDIRDNNITPSLGVSLQF